MFERISIVSSLSFVSDKGVGVYPLSLENSFTLFSLRSAIMAGAKRMSADEKRKVVLGVYHSTKAVFTEKEILTLAAKAGVNANT
jgi:hypothetical protein